MIWQGRVAPPVGVTGCAKARAMAEPTFTLRQLNAYNVIATLAAKRGWDTAGYDAAKTEAARCGARTWTCRPRMRNAASPRCARW